MTLRISRRSMLKAAGAATGAVGIGIGTGVAASPATAASTSFAHPGMLHTRADLKRMAAKVKAGAAPYMAGFAKLTANRHSQSTWLPNPQATVIRGGGGGQNYGILYRDIHAAYQNALRWKVTGDTAHADTARDTSDMVARLRPEGGGGDYGPNSGGYDELGFGTLAFTRDKATAAESAAAPSGSAPTPAAKSGSSESSGSSSSSGDSATEPSSSPSAQGGKSDGDLAAIGSSDLPLWTAASGITAVAGGLLLLLRRRGQARREAE